MQRVRLGNRVQVHYVKRLPEGSGATSGGHPPLEPTAGCEHLRLLGLGSALVGLLPGSNEGRGTTLAATPSPL
jgi:hypothetical protein